MVPWIPVPFSSRWNLDSGFQLLAGFRIPRAEFQIPMPTGKKGVLGFWNLELFSIGWWNYLGGIIRVLLLFL